MTMIAAQTGWREVLAATRAYNRAHTGRVDMRPYWRALGYRVHAGAAESVIWAQAFAGVLDNIGLYTKGIPPDIST
ncbi:MAG: hypothetical protein ABIF71_03885 [Planctomycetota bacterium]